MKLPKVKPSSIILFLAVCVAIISLPLIVIQQYEGNRSQNNHHTSSIKKDNQIIQLQMEIRSAQTAGHQKLDEIQTLQTEFNELLNTATPALVNGQNDLLAKINALGVQVDAMCKSTPGCIP